MKSSSDLKTGAAGNMARREGLPPTTCRALGIPVRLWHWAGLQACRLAGLLNFNRKANASVASGWAGTATWKSLWSFAVRQPKHSQIPHQCVERQLWWVAIALVHLHDNHGVAELAAESIVTRNRKRHHQSSKRRCGA